MSKKIISIAMLMLICVSCVGNAANKSFNKVQQKYINEKKFEVEMLQEDEKILKSKYSNVKVSAYQVVTERKFELRGLRDDANKKFKNQIDNISTEIDKKNKEKALKKELIIFGKSVFAKAYNAVIYSQIEKLENEILMLKQKKEDIRKNISQNNERYKECGKELEDIKKTINEQLDKISVKYSTLKNKDKRLKEENYKLKQEMEKYNFKKVKKRYGKIIEIHTDKNNLIKSLTEQKKVVNSTLKASVEKVVLICV